MTARSAAAKIRVLIVDDSPTFRAVLRAVLEADGGFDVLDAVSDGESALERLERLRPQLVTLDIELPGCSGVDVTREIMRRRPTPIVILSGLQPSDPRVAFRATEQGALAVLRKPTRLLRLSEDSEERRRLLDTLRTVAAARLGGPRPGRAARPLRSRPAPRQRLAPRKMAVVAIGASAGGPPCVATLLSGLSAGHPPVLLVQHIIASFASGYSSWLAERTGRTVLLGRPGLRPKPGHVYVAPPDLHMTVSGDGSELVLLDTPAVSHFKPSATVLFRSVAEAYGPRAACVVLSGMGDDGADGALAASKLGSLVLVQDPETAAVGAMPQAALDRGAAPFGLDLDAITRTLAAGG